MWFYQPLLQGAAQQLGGPAAYTLTADVQTYVITPTTTLLEKDSRLPITAAALDLVATATNLRIGYFLSATTQTYTIAGVDVTLTYTPGTGFTLNIVAGSFSLSPTTTGLFKGSLVTAVVNSFTLLGNVANLLKKSLITATTRVFNLTPTVTGVYRGTLVTATPSSYTIGGTTTNLTTTRNIMATPQSYIMQRNVADLIYSGALAGGRRTRLTNTIINTV